MGEIHQAAAMGDLEKLTRLLAEEPSRVHEPEGGEWGEIGGIHQIGGDQPLHCAANSAVVQLLVAAGADVNALGACGHSVLHRNVYEERLDTVRALLLAGADPNLGGKTSPPITYARDDAMFQLLLEHGAVLQTCASSLLESAAAMGNLHRVRLLLRHGIHADAASSCGTTPLFAAKTAEVLRELVTAGADIHHRNDRQNTPLLRQAYDGHTGCVAALIELGADPNAVNEAGETALWGAAATGYVEIIEMLLRAGADPNLAQYSHGVTPLHQAMIHDQTIEHVRLLVEAGANLHARKKGGATPLRLAQLYANQAAADYLREKMGLTAGIPPVELLHLLQCAVHLTRPEIIAWTEEGYLTRWVCEAGSDRPRLAAAMSRSDLLGGLAFLPGEEAGLLLQAMNGHCFTVEWDSLEPRELPDAFPEIPEFEVPWFYQPAASPDGNWVALPLNDERVVVHSLRTGETSFIPCGEYPPAMAFDPAGRRVAIGCSFQAGSYVSIRNLPAHQPGLCVAQECTEVERGSYKSGAADFVDALTALAFSADGSRLALFETSSVYHKEKPVGWRGNLVMIDPRDGRVVWTRSIDASITGDERRLADAEHPMGFWSDVAFLPDGNVTCGSTNGCVPVFDTATGALKTVRGARLPSGERYAGPIVKLLPLADGTLWTALYDHGLLRIEENQNDE